MRISSPIGEVRLNVHRSSNGLAHAAGSSAARGETAANSNPRGSQGLADGGNGNQNGGVSGAAAPASSVAAAPISNNNAGGNNGNGNGNGGANVNVVNGNGNGNGRNANGNGNANGTATATETATETERQRQRERKRKRPQILGMDDGAGGGQREKLGASRSEAVSSASPRCVRSGNRIAGRVASWSAKYVDRFQIPLDAARGDRRHRRRCDRPVLDRESWHLALAAANPCRVDQQARHRRRPRHCFRRRFQFAVQPRCGCRVYQGSEGCRRISGPAVLPPIDAWPRQGCANSLESSLCAICRQCLVRVRQCRDRRRWTGSPLPIWRESRRAVHAVDGSLARRPKRDGCSAVLDRLRHSRGLDPEGLLYRRPAR